MRSDLVYFFFFVVHLMPLSRNKITIQFHYLQKKREKREKNAKRNSLSRNKITIKKNNDSISLFTKKKRKKRKKKQRETRTID
jgi:hypothetical protein